MFGLILRQSDASTQSHNRRAHDRYPHKAQKGLNEGCATGLSIALSRFEFYKLYSHRKRVDQGTVQRKRVGPLSEKVCRRYNLSALAKESTEARLSCHGIPKDLNER